MLEASDTIAEGILRIWDHDVGNCGGPWRTLKGDWGVLDDDQQTLERVSRGSLSFCWFPLPVTEN